VSLFLDFQAALAGRYSLEQELGRGGMGIVYRARDLRLERVVAIKLLPPQLADSAERRQRFVREARMAAQLSHPHIIPIHAVEEVGAFVFFVMSYIDGETLGTRLRRDGRLRPADALRILHAAGGGRGTRGTRIGRTQAQRISNRTTSCSSGAAACSSPISASRVLAAPSEATRGKSRLVSTPEYMSPEHKH
jgi:serine/threonine-protein kinase